MTDETITDDPVAALMAERGEDLLDRLNADFEDSMLLVGRVLGGRPRATSAVVRDVDGDGVVVLITDADGEHTGRIDFAEQVTDPMALTGHLLGLVVRARAESGEDGETSAEREVAELGRIRTFLTTVARVEDVHPHLRRITFAGGDLATFAPSGPDTFCYVLLPPPGRSDLTIDESFTWEAYGAMAPAEQPVGAYYTVRAWRPEVTELDMLFVLHGEGHASGWAARARRGDPAALWGPRTGYHPPAGTDWLLLVADETGLPAVAVILEQLPYGMPARVLAEVADEHEHQDLPVRHGVEITWLHRDGAPAGTTTLLADAVRAMPWPAGRPYVWGAGESRTMTAVRRHVRHERGLERAAVSLVAYWRHPSSPPE
ncbi:MAG TPA: SIP domain-containing protein [Ilumatobacteraceae bacterium]|nr:SIP domain-containing protein [Ilumatobacteraceae bacterium]